jgi:uncharacterized protein
VSITFTQQAANYAQTIQGYAGAGYRVNGFSYAGGIIVLPERTVDWPVGALSDVSLDSLAPVIAADPKVEVLLLGTGAAMALPPKALREALAAAGLAMDAMDSKAAARTYNLLVMEGRRVAAALLPLV